MVGSALARTLTDQGKGELLLPNRQQLDLADPITVTHWMKEHRPDVVFLAAAKVGGIAANSNFPVDFLLDNLAIEINLIKAAYELGVEKLIFLGSSCIYPKHAEQPIKETSLLTGALEPTNEWYAIAKIAGIKLCQAYRTQYGCDFISAMPCNLFGKNDNFDLETSHVLPALMRKFHDAKTNKADKVWVWGSGTPLREFLYVDELANALVFVAENYSELEHINIGAEKEISIKELAELIAQIVGFKGEICFDSSKPDGTLRKMMDCSKLSKLGWRPQLSLQAAISETYKWYCDNHAE